MAQLYNKARSLKRAFPGSDEGSIRAMKSVSNLRRAVENQFAPVYTGGTGPSFAGTYSGGTGPSFGPTYVGGTGIPFAGPIGMAEGTTTHDTYLKTLIDPEKYPFPTPDANCETVVTNIDSLNKSFQVPSNGYDMIIVITPRNLDHPVKICKFQTLGSSVSVIGEFDSLSPIESAPFSRDYAKLYEAGRTTALVTNIAGSTITAGSIVLSGNYVAVASESINNFDKFGPSDLVSQGITTKDQMNLRSLYANPLVSIHGPEIISTVRPFPSPSTYDVTQKLYLKGVLSKAKDEVESPLFQVSDGSLPKYVYNPGGRIVVSIGPTDGGLGKESYTETQITLYGTSAPVRKLVAGGLDSDTTGTDVCFLAEFPIEKIVPSPYAEPSVTADIFPALQGTRIYSLDNAFGSKSTTYYDVPVEGVPFAWKLEAITIKLESFPSSSIKDFDVTSTLTLDRGYTETDRRPCTIVALTELSASTVINITGTRLTEAIPGGGIAPDVKAKVFQAGIRTVEELFYARRCFTDLAYPVARLTTGTESIAMSENISGSTPSFAPALLGAGGAGRANPNRPAFGPVGSVLGSLAGIVGDLIPFSNPRGANLHFASEDEDGDVGPNEASKGVSIEEAKLQLENLKKLKEKGTEISHPTTPPASLNCDETPPRTPDEVDGWNSEWDCALTVTTNYLSETFEFQADITDDDGMLEAISCSLISSPSIGLAMKTPYNKVMIHAHSINKQGIPNNMYKSVEAEIKDSEDLIKLISTELLPLRWHSSLVGNEILENEKPDEKPEPPKPHHQPPFKKLKILPTTPKFANGDAEVGVVLEHRWKVLGRVRPAPRYNWEEAMSKCDKRTSQRLIELMSGQVPAKEEGRINANYGYCHAPAAKMVNGAEVGHVFTILVTTSPISKMMEDRRGEMYEGPREYGQVEIEYKGVDGAVTTGSIYVDEMFAHDEDAIKMCVVAACVASRAECYFNINIEEPATGGSMGLALIFACLAVNHPKMAATGRLEWPGDDSPVQVRPVGLVLAKALACAQEGLYLIGGRGAFTDKLLTSPEHQKTMTTIAQMWAGDTNPEANILRAEDLTAAMLMALRVSMIGSKTSAPGGISIPQPEEEVKRGMEINKATMAIRNRVMEELRVHPESAEQEYDVEIGKEIYKARVLDKGWWKNYRTELAETKLTMAKIDDKIKAGMVDKLLGIAKQVIARKAKKERKEQSLLKPKTTGLSKGSMLKEKILRRLEKYAKGTNVATPEPEGNFKYGKVKNTTTTTRGTVILERAAEAKDRQGANALVKALNRYKVPPPQGTTWANFSKMMHDEEEKQEMEAALGEPLGEEESTASSAPESEVDEARRDIRNLTRARKAPVAPKKAPKRRKEAYKAGRGGIGVGLQESAKERRRRTSKNLQKELRAAVRKGRRASPARAASPTLSYESL